MSVIRLVRDAAYELARKLRAGENLELRPGHGDSSAPAGGSTHNRVPAFPSFQLPTAKCRFCGEQLRAVLRGQDRLIVCDSCELFTLAPASHRQLIDDIIGEAIAINRTN